MRTYLYFLLTMVCILCPSVMPNRPCNHSLQPRRSCYPVKDGLKACWPVKRGPLIIKDSLIFYSFDLYYSYIYKSSFCFMKPAF